MKFQPYAAVILVSLVSRAGASPQAPNFFDPSEFRPQIQDAKAAADRSNPLYTGKLDYPAPDGLYPGDEDPNRKELDFLVDHRGDVMRAQKWWSKILTDDFLPGIAQPGPRLFYGRPEIDDVIHQIWEPERAPRRDRLLNQDDLIVERYAVPDGWVQIIDGRSVTIAIKIADPAKFSSPTFEATSKRHPPKNGERTLEMSDMEGVAYNRADPAPLEVAASAAIPSRRALEKFVHVVFRSAFHFDFSHEKEAVTTRIKTGGYSRQSGAYGVALTDAKIGDWIMNGGITWWSNGRVVVFDVRKLVMPRGGPDALNGRPADAPSYAFGLPFDDPRRFSQFEESGESIDFSEVFNAALNDATLKKYRP